MKERICRNIKSLRLSRNLSQTKMGRELGISRSKISSWELGRREVSLKDALMLVKYFHVNINDFVMTDL